MNNDNGGDDDDRRRRRQRWQEVVDEKFPWRIKRMRKPVCRPCWFTFWARLAPETEFAALFTTWYGFVVVAADSHFTHYTDSMAVCASTSYKWKTIATRTNTNLLCLDGNESKVRTTLQQQQQWRRRRQQWQKHYRHVWNSRWRCRTVFERRTDANTEHTNVWHFYWFVSGYNANFAVGKNIQSKSMVESVVIHLYSTNTIHQHKYVERFTLHEPVSAGDPFAARCCVWMNKCTCLGAAAAAAAPASTTVYSPGCILFNAIQFNSVVCVIALTQKRSHSNSTHSARTHRHKPSSQSSTERLRWTFRCQEEHLVLRSEYKYRVSERV